MSTLSILIDLIKKSERCELKAYKCPAGVWTCGWGCTGYGIKEGTEWTQEHADYMLDVLADSSIDVALKASPVLKTQSPGRQAAIADFIYNCGLTAYKSSTLKRNIDANDFKTAQESIKMWDKAHVNGEAKVLKGLTIRRQAESDLLKD